MKVENSRPTSNRWERLSGGIKDGLVMTLFNEKSSDPVAGKKWMRQLVWVLLAYALWLHRNNKLPQMGNILKIAK